MHGRSPCSVRLHPRLHGQRRWQCPRRAFFLLDGRCLDGFHSIDARNRVGDRPIHVPQRSLRTACHIQSRPPQRNPAGQVDERFKQRFGVWLVKDIDSSNRSARHLRALHGLHASGLHAELAGGRTEVQMPVPRQRLLQERHQFRRSHAAASGTLCDLAGGRRADPCGQEHEVPIRKRRVGGSAVFFENSN